MINQPKPSLPEIILGSSSPRRRELLSNVTSKFIVVKPETPEIPHPGETPEHYVARNAREKAEWIASRRAGRFIVICADTIVVSGEEILEKPRDHADARRMLTLLGGKTHHVLTGVHLIGRGVASPSDHATTVHSFVTKTAVTFKNLAPAEMDAYIKTGEPFDKAGGYAAQGRGSWFVQKVEGSWTNVVGLPMAELLDALEREFHVRLWEYDRDQK